MLTKILAPNMFWHCTLIEAVITTGAIACFFFAAASAP
jgi:hypothetical protein